MGVEGAKDSIPKVTKTNKENCRLYSNWDSIIIDDFYQKNASKHFEKLPPIEQFKWIMEFITFMSYLFHLKYSKYPENIVNIDFERNISF